MTLIEAAKQALWPLKAALTLDELDRAWVDEAITDLSEAIEHVEKQEAVIGFDAWFDAEFAKQNGFVSTGDPMFYDSMLLCKAWALMAWRKATPPAQSAPEAQLQQEPAAGLYALLFVNNWDGEGNHEYLIAKLSDQGLWTRYENDSPLFEFVGDKIISAWPLFEATPPAAQAAQRKPLTD
jgi:hypothetical protein